MGDGKRIIKKEVINRLLQKIISCYQADEFAKHSILHDHAMRENMYGSPSNIRIDVPNPTTPSQRKFAEFKNRIENQSIGRRDFPDNITWRCKTEIDEYFACFDPKDPNYKSFWHIDDGKPGFWESLIPVLGSAKEAEYNFKNGNYGNGIGYSLLAISDIFLIKSIATGIAKGAFKIVGSHSWNATRKWALKHGWVKKGEPLHHWLIQQSAAKKYGLEAISNQPWNLIKFPNASQHMRFGHGVKFGETAAGSLGQQFWYGTPHWFKIGTTNVGGHIILSEDE